MGGGGRGEKRVSEGGSVMGGLRAWLGWERDRAIFSGAWELVALPGGGLDEREVGRVGFGWVRRLEGVGSACLVRYGMETGCASC